MNANIRVNVEPNRLGELEPNLKIKGKLRVMQWVDCLITMLIHYLVYQEVFYLLFNRDGLAIGLGGLYAAGIGLLSWQYSSFRIHLRLANLELFDHLRAQSVEVKTSFEWMRPSFEGFVQVSLGFLLLAGADLGLSFMASQVTGRFEWHTFLLGLLKIGIIVCLKKQYCRAQTRFGHLVGDYALKQKQEEDQKEKHLN